MTLKSPKRLIVVGESHLAYLITHKLVHIGHHVVVIERNELPATSGFGHGVTHICKPRASYKELLSEADLSSAHAVFIVTDHEKINLEVALIVRQLGFEKKIIAQLFNRAIRNHFAEHIPNLTALSAPLLAAHEIAEVILKEVPNGTGRVRTPATGTGMHHHIHALRLFLRDPYLRALVFGLALLLVVPTVYFAFVLKISILDSIYLVVSSFASVGLIDFSLRDQNFLTKYMGAILLLGSLVATSFLVAILSDIIQRSRDILPLGRRGLRLKDHIIVCGLGRVGYQILMELHERGIPVLGIDQTKENRFLHQLQMQAVPVVVMDATIDRALHYANISEARALIAATSDDLKNLEIGFGARAFNHLIDVYLRIFESELADGIKKQLAIKHVFSTSAIAAPLFIDACFGNESKDIVEED